MDDAIEAEAVVVLPGIGCLVSHGLQQVVEGSCDHCTQNRAHEEDPDFANIVVVDHSWTQGSSWVYRGSSVINAFVIHVSSSHYLVSDQSMRDIPIRCATNNAKPMANGAMYDVRLFSTASMMIVMTSSAVRITSRNRPWTGSVPDEREFSACSFPGSNAETTPAAVIAPRNWTGITQTRRTQSKAPAIQSPIATWKPVS